MRRILMLLAFAVALPGTAGAQNSHQGVYLELRGGGSFLTDSDFKESGTTIDADFKPGWLIDGAVGYSHEIGLRGEVAIGYRRNEFDELKSGGITADIDNGHISAFTAMFNGYYDFHLHKFGVGGALGNLSPFVGGGLGVAVLDLGGSDIGDEEDTVFAYQATAGLTYHFTPNIAGSVSYAYFATADPKFDGSESDYNSHNALVGIRYTF